MQPKRPFPPVRAQPPPPPRLPPSRQEVLRARLRGLYTRFHSPLLFAAGMLIALLALVIYDSSKPAPQRLTQRDINAAVARAMASATPAPYYASRVYEIIRPSLVRIEALASDKQGSLGTGVVIDEDGNILASLHVVADAAQITVVFADGTESEAEVVAREQESDLAVLRPKVIPDDLLPATLASSEGLQVGDEVVAVGNPFGISNSLSAGVVSGIGRNYKSPKTGETLKNLIQFDAAVNPGNSGGPLLARNGEVVGIVTALLNPGDQDFFVGIGFAVPIEAAAAAAGSPAH